MTKRSPLVPFLCIIGLLLACNKKKTAVPFKPAISPKVYDFRYKEASWFQVSSEQDLLFNQSHPHPGMRAAIIPHAGLSYCGPIIKKTLDQFSWKDIETVILLSTRHNNTSQENYLLPNQMKQLFAPYDSSNVIHLHQPKSFEFLPQSLSEFEKEHSWQLILPFIGKINEQRLTKGKKPVLLIPIIIGQYDPRLQDEIVAMLKKDSSTILIANTDLLHCGPQYGEVCPLVVGRDGIQRFNEETIHNIIGTIESNESLKAYRDSLSTMCGFSAISTFVGICKALRLSPSGYYIYQTSDQEKVQTDSKTNSVGYVGMAFKGDEDIQTHMGEWIKVPRKVLSNLTRSDIQKLPGNRALINKLSSQYSDPNATIIHRIAGLFVTIRKKADHSLVGCIGDFNIDPTDIPKAIAHNALYAAFMDSRSPLRNRSAIHWDHYQFDINFLEKPIVVYKKEKGGSLYDSIHKHWKSGLHGITLYFDQENKQATYLASVFKESFGIEVMTPENWRKIVTSLKEKCGVGPQAQILKAEIYQCLEVKER